MVVWTDHAKAQLRHIYNYIAEHHFTHGSYQNYFLERTLASTIIQEFQQNPLYNAHIVALATDVQPVSP